MSASAGASDRRTARLRLRRPVAGDVKWLSTLYSDPRNYVHAPGGAHTLERARVKAAADVSDRQVLGIGYWLVEHVEEPVGMLGIRPMPLAAALGQTPGPELDADDGFVVFASGW